MCIISNAWHHTVTLATGTLAIAFDIATELETERACQSRVSG